MPRRLTALSMRSGGRRVIVPFPVPRCLGNGRKFLMLTCDHRYDSNPNKNKRHIDRGILPNSKSQLYTGKDQSCRDYVSGAPKERVDRSLGLVLRFAACRKKERLTSRILDGIVRSVFHHFC